MLRSLKDSKKKIRQNDLCLYNTRKVADCIRHAKIIGHDVSLTHELYLLLIECAKMEWGHGVIVDDFSVPGKFVVKKNLMEETI